MYWSGDLAYRDADGFVYYAGRTADWLRVDGENLAAAPIERILLRHPAVAEAAVYAVPDPSRRATSWSPRSCSRGDARPGEPRRRSSAAQPDLGPKAVAAATSGSSTPSRAPPPTRCSSATCVADGPSTA